MSLSRVPLIINHGDRVVRVTRSQLPPGVLVPGAWAAQRSQEDAMNQPTVRCKVLSTFTCYQTTYVRGSEVDVPEGFYRERQHLLALAESSPRPSRAKVQSPSMQKAAPEPEEEDDGDDDALEEWPKKMPPDQYLSRWPGGEHAPLARRILGADQE